MLEVVLHALGEAWGVVHRRYTTDALARWAILALETETDGEQQETGMQRDPRCVRSTKYEAARKCGERGTEI